MNVDAFFDPRTWTLTYLVWDPDTRDAVVVDPVLDFDRNRAALSDGNVRRLEARVRELGLTVHWVLETHVHADHLTGADLLRKRLGARIAIGARITEVQAFFGRVFELGDPAPADGTPFDRLVADGEVVVAGSLRFEAIGTQGHTPACTSWRVRDAVFTGDTLFLPDQGTGRCDFPNGSAAELYDSVRRLYALPPETRVFVGHDYQPGGREVRWESTIGAEREGNVQLRADTDRSAFVAWRTERDRTLALPNLLFEALQVNVRAGALPNRGEARRFLKLPLNLFDGPVPE